MDVVVLNGARAGDTKVNEVSNILQATLQAYAEVSTFTLRDLKIADCLGCFGCWIKTPGQCVIDDASREIARKLPLSDLIVYITPIVFGGYSYELKKVLDRQISSLLPFIKKVNGEMHHPQRYEKRGKIAAVGILPEPDASSEAIFKKLLYRNSLNKQATHQATAIIYETDAAEAIKVKIDKLLTDLEVKN